MKLSITILLLAVALTLSQTVSAQTASPSASASPSPTTIRDAVKDKVSEELAQIKQAVTRRAYVGTVAAKTDLTLTITNLRNQPRTANLVTDATIKLVGGKDGTVADIKVGDFVIAMGDADGKGVLTIKRLLVIAKPSADVRQVKFITVTKSTSTTITAGETTYKITSTTKFTGKTTATDIKEEDKLVIITSGPTNLLLVHKFQ